MQENLITIVVSHAYTILSEIGWMFTLIGSSSRTHEADLPEISVHNLTAPASLLVGCFLLSIMPTTLALLGYPKAATCPLLINFRLIYIFFHVLSLSVYLQASHHEMRCENVHAFNLQEKIQRVDTWVFYLSALILSKLAV